MQVGGDLETSRWSAEMASREPRMLAAVAIHPNEAPRYEAAGELDAALAEIDELAGRPRVRAIGETGLDFFRTDESGRAAQFRSFEAHIEIAKKHGLALQIHDRDAHDEVLATLRRVGAPEKTVFHCFSGDADLAKICADNGWYLSFAGTVTFKNAGHLREALEVVPRSQHPDRDGCAVPHADAVPRAPQLPVPDPAHPARDGRPPRHRGVDARRPDLLEHRAGLRQLGRRGDHPGCRSPYDEAIDPAEIA